MSQHPFMMVGLGETDSEVRNYDAAIQNEVDALDKALMTDATRKYGPDAFAATISAAQLPAFQADRDFYRSWQAFKARWDAEHASVQKTTFYVFSADEYRRLDGFAQDAKAWRKTIEGRGTPINAPPITEKTPLGGSNPIVPVTSAVSDFTDTVKWVGGGILALGLLYVISQAVKK